MLTNSVLITLTFVTLLLVVVPLSIRRYRPLYWTGIGVMVFLMIDNTLLVLKTIHGVAWENCIIFPVILTGFILLGRSPSSWRRAS